MIEWEKGMVNRGNWGKIQAVMARAEAGEEITLGFLGGSITQGSLASTPEKCYAYRVYQWWKQSFPKAQIHYINAGIGGTSSQFGVARVEEDLLRYEPDFVLTEFSVNDENTAHFQQTYEGLVRRILKRNKALLLMNNVCYDTGASAQEVHLEIARHYDVPCVSMKSTIYAALCRDEMKNRDITPDDLHPNDAGHDLVARVICHMLEKIRMGIRGEPGSPELPEPITPNLYENSVRYQNHNARPELNGFTVDETPQEHITQCFRRGFTAWHQGDSITFRVQGRCIAVQYRKSVIQPTPIAQITVDGGRAITLDGNFRETWGDCLWLDTVAEGLESGEHTVCVTVTQTHENDAVPFYLVSVIGA